jgi:hypothetical protein
VGKRKYLPEQPKKKIKQSTHAEMACNGLGVYAGVPEFAQPVAQPSRLSFPDSNGCLFMGEWNRGVSAVNEFMKDRMSTASHAEDEVHSSCSTDVASPALQQLSDTTETPESTRHECYSQPLHLFCETSTGEQSVWLFSTPSSY